mmetsp:Transcript_7660/g.10584  ORF Transcript_7660/g.10584 Transcript_7660/m.10584 type:complete len:444 (-) Transcript_7660:201-1532(-)
MSLKVGFALSLLSRISIFFTNSKTVLLWNVCLFLPMGNCLGIPVLTTGIRRYTTAINRGFAFGLFYVIMNVAALLSGPVVDMCTILHKDKNNAEADSNAKYDEVLPEWSLTGYRIVILTGIIANVLAVLVAFTVREIKLDDKQQAPIAAADATNDSNSNSKTTTSVSTFQPLKGSPTQILRETLSTPSFWRFLAVVMITLNIRMIFRHLDATLPKYMVREFGPSTPKGTIYSINPALIIILVPIVQAATRDVNPLVMIHYGIYISAASVFCLVISTSVTACVLFVIVLSIGEAIWSPRLYDYTMSISKEGREGTYMALSSAPLFLAKLPVGFMSGYLLQKYCPEEGERNSKMMWLIIALSTVVSPILLTVFWGYVSKKDEDDVKVELKDFDDEKSVTEYMADETPFTEEVNESSNLVIQRKNVPSASSSRASNISDEDSKEIV